jgi:HEAT repeat protein
VLLRLLASTADADKIAACRALGGFDSPAVREALKKTVAEALPGLEVWKACTLARVQLNEPDTAGAINGVSHDMTADALLDAADVMVATGNEQVIHLLQRVAREGRPISRMEAAARLADLDPELAARVVDAGLGDPDPAVRARALIAEKRLKRAPSAMVRKLLIDPDEIVQLRAAEAVLVWVARTLK